ncbi:MAG: CDGSH iron-sulfur domain-containing protein [Anaerolineae bacterium]|nr:CDGSH iron-sulfur domain-containing protein [Anaerolineae bacterium]
MTAVYTGKDRRYTGEAVDITYDVKRCIHAEHCINHLPAVFDKDRRPWILADAAAADHVAAVAELCPSGALHYERKDGGQQETAPAQNVIRLRHNGPLEIRGDLMIEDTTVILQDETRAMLCRCGVSQNKPFCDNQHREIHFEPVDPAPSGSQEPGALGPGRLQIVARHNGPLELDGPVRIVNEAGETIFVGQAAILCRCGGSSRKPFCDGTHERIAFTAE